MARRILSVRRYASSSIPAMVLTLSLALVGVSSTASVRAQGAATVMIMQSASAGQYLSDPNGNTLYVFSADTAGAGTSACNSGCSGPWPPFQAPASGLAAPDGVTGMLATITRADGNQQVTYNGMPLYFFVRDTNAGDVNGQGVTAFGGTWTVAAP